MDFYDVTAHKSSDLIDAVSWSCFAVTLLQSWLPLSCLSHQSGVPGPQGQPQVANKIVAWTGVLEWQEVKVIYRTIGVLNASSLPLQNQQKRTLNSDIPQFNPPASAGRSEERIAKTTVGWVASHRMTRREPLTPAGRFYVLSLVVYLFIMPLLVFVEAPASLGHAKFCPASCRSDFIIHLE